MDKKVSRGSGFFRTSMETKAKIHGPTVLEAQIGQKKNGPVLFYRRGRAIWLYGEKIS
jgi:hypothetical protein